ncbi:M1 family metallopeptidase [Crocinitomicaceae bacterium]|nr:M1 family metallopeptidase [Crocinitomicaceae bacterium]
MRTLYILASALIICSTTFAQHEYLDHPVDILNYDVSIELEDSTDEIRVYELITFKLDAPCDSFFIDLFSQNDSTGMHLFPEILIDFENTKFRHENDRIWIHAKSEWEVGSVHEIKLFFTGVPETGLIIGKNKFGNRTFFGDNWPNRAHHWFACIDHPSDKATIKYTVVAPVHYQCIATGKFLGRKLVNDGTKMKYDFVTSIDLPTKVMVIGVADFFWDLYKPDPGFDVSAWVYPENKEEGLSDMKVSLEVLDYFIEILGAYPFEKLANVQSTTQFGGMENAGNIFYDENAVTGEGTMEALIAHEVAHQWFGNSASEEDWPHLWLSEGFATYLTDLYFEQKYGREVMNERLIGERIRVLNFAKNYDHPVVDTEYEELMHLLNPNSYQKGAWFLHMLREEVGDSSFFAGIRTYYKAYQYDNANTEDFRKIMEKVSESNLERFFLQWLYTPGHPILEIASDIKGKNAEIAIQQMQEDHTFEFDLEIEVIFNNGETELISIPVDSNKETFQFESRGRIKGYRIDPNVKLLFEEVEY